MSETEGNENEICEERARHQQGKKRDKEDG
jgi:hypothetical protein